MADRSIRQVKMVITYEKDGKSGEFRLFYPSDDFSNLSVHTSRIINYMINWLERSPAYRFKSSADPDMLEAVEIMENDPDIKFNNTNNDLEEAIKVGDTVPTEIEKAEPDISGAEGEHQDQPEISIKDESGKEVDAELEKPRARQHKEEDSFPPRRQAQDHLSIYVRHEALILAQRHAESDRKREVGGVLLGATTIDKNGHAKVYITGIVRALLAIGERSSVNFTPDAWDAIWRIIDAHPEYGDEGAWKIVGWYHSHPGFGIFLSSADLFIHEGFFGDRTHVALVVDPRTDKLGFFCWDKRHKKVVSCDQKRVIFLKDTDLLRIMGLRDLPPSEIATETESTVVLSNSEERTPVPSTGVDEDRDAVHAPATTRDKHEKDVSHADEPPAIADQGIAHHEAENPEPKRADKNGYGARDMQ